LIASYTRDSEAGLNIFAFFASVYCITDRPTDYRKGQTFYIVYGAILLALITIDVAVAALCGQYMWIDHRNYPGGPTAYFEATSTAWFNVFGMSARAVANILGDGLLVRLFFLLRSTARNRRGESVDSTQWLTGVPVLYDLGLPMARYRPSGTDIPGFLWCGRNPIPFDEPNSSLSTR
jgi:hypothetical protein